MRSGLGRRSAFFLASCAFLSAGVEGQFHGLWFTSSQNHCSPFDCDIPPSSWNDCCEANQALFATSNFNPAGGAGYAYDYILSSEHVDGPVSLMSIEGLAATGSPIVGASFNVLVVGATSSCVWTHQTTGANTALSFTTFDRPYLNGNPSARFLVQELTSSTDPSGPPSVAAFYESSAKFQWGLFNQNGSTMTLGRYFSIIDDSCFAGVNFFLSIPGCSTAGGRCYLSHPAVDGRPDAVILVTPRWSSATNVFNSKAIGVRYDDALDQWAIFNQDGSAVPTGAEYFVGIVTTLYFNDFETGNSDAWSSVAP